MKQKRFTSIILILVIALSMLIVPPKTITVYAGQDISQMGEWELKQLDALYTYLSGQGFCLEAIAGIIGNADCESGLTESNGKNTAHMYFGDLWFCGANGNYAIPNWYKDKGYEIGDITGEISFIVESEHNFENNAKQYCKSEYASMRVLKTAGGKTGEDGAKFVAELFAVGWENCYGGNGKQEYGISKSSSNYQGLDDRKKWAVQAYNYLKDKKPSTPTSDKKAISDETWAKVKSDLGLSDAELTIIKTLFFTCIEAGFTPQAAIGQIANVKGESGFDPMCVGVNNENDVGVGLFQITDNTFSKTGSVAQLSKYCSEHCKDCKGTVTAGKHGQITLCKTGIHEIEWEFENVLCVTSEDKSAFKTWGSDTEEGYGAYQRWINNWQKCVPDGIDITKQVKVDSKDYYVNFPKAETKVNSLADYKNIKDPVEAANCYNWTAERSQAVDFPLHMGSYLYNHPSATDAELKKETDYWFNRNDTVVKKYGGGKYDKNSDGSAMKESRGYNLVQFYKSDADGTPSGNKLSFAYKLAKALDVDSLDLGDVKNNPIGDTEVADDVKTIMMDLKYYNEIDLMSYCKLNELNIDAEMLKNATRDNLGQSDVYALDNWKSVADEDKWTVTRVFRLIITLIGILLTVWAIFLYLAYWLDRINNIIDIRFVSFLTLGKMEVSEDELGASYGEVKKERGKVTTINHKAVLKICITTLVLGVLLLTGVLYKFVLGVIQWVSSIFMD